MSDLASRILDLGTRLNQVTHILSQVLFPAKKKRTRNRRHAESSTLTPSWADEVKKLLQISADLQDVIREVSRSSPQSIDLVHRSPPAAGPSEDVFLQPSFLPAPQEQQNIGPCQPQLPTQAVQALGQQAQSTTSSEERENGPCSSAESAPTATTSMLLTSVPSDIEPTSLLSTESSEQVHEAAPSTNSVIQPSSPLAQPKFSLTTDEMGPDLVAKIAQMVPDSNFNGLIRVKDLAPVDWNCLVERTCPPQYRDQLANEYSPDPTMTGCSRLRVSRSANFRFPKFSITPPKPSDEEVWNYLDRLAHAPPRGQIPYYVGPPLTSDFDLLLHPGSELSEFTDIEGVNSPYWHVGEGGSGTANHREDADLRSANIVVFGWKLWILIRDYHTARFEEFVKRHWRTNRCAQFVRHLSLFISPTTLREARIDFTIHCAGPGDMVVTSPGQYHLVANFSTCFAVAINFLLPGETVIPANLAVCRQCGLFPLNHDHAGLRAVSCPLTDNDTEQPAVTESPDISVVEGTMLQPNQRQHELRPMTKRVKKTAALRPQKRPKNHSIPTPVNHELKEAAEQVKEVDPLCKIPSFGAKSLSIEVFKLAAVIYSRRTISQFCSLVRSRRDIRTRTNFSRDVFTRIGQRLSNISQSERRYHLELLCARLELSYFAQDIEDSKQGRTRADPKFIKEFLKQTKLTRDTFERLRAKGNKWNRLCKEYNGLLCLIVLDGKNPFCISPQNYLDLKEAEVPIFEDLLNDLYIKSLCSAANAFQQSLDCTSYDTEFCWEAETQPIAELPEEKLLELLQPFPLAPQNIYDQDKYDWPRPPSWPEEWPWPVDPTAVLGAEETKCDFCDEESCNCIIHKGSEHKPRIKYYGEKGRGLQAVACNPGEVAYQKGDLVGFITGIIVPRGTYDDSWTVDFVRPDLPYEPVVCQIRCAEAGNCFRLLNHSCAPSARCVQMKASGRYVTAVKATREIYDGAEITICYGYKTDWIENECLCEAHPK
ncbi:Putative SET domain, JmjC domain, SET domain superfamily protein [Colletotrichum destructivum]|uniref:SET domain, JmjC domain, SET domain superfamily protein n=1 Tax=Colletotrichum destructivum TaxID=34406 RepID=A0AAX4J1E1_9PEZI|nr:Putative SET domain, JmjC domain, SET domain superfamily protein [Colletotrichum destructivum]